MNATLLGAIIGVGGTLLGVIITSLFNWWLGRRRQAQIRCGVRLLLGLECTQNLAALFEFWGKVSSEGVHLPDSGEMVGVGYSMHEGEFDKRQRLAREPLPVWGRLMWESQAGLVATALSSTEIDRLYKMYSGLEAFAARQAELRAEFETPEGKSFAANYSDWMRKKGQGHSNYGARQEEFDQDMTLIPFNEKTRPLWAACQRIYDQALPYKNTNVIEEDPPARKWIDRPRHWFRRASKMRLRIEG